MHAGAGLLRLQQKPLTECLYYSSAIRMSVACPHAALPQVPPDVAAAIEIVLSTAVELLVIDTRTCGFI